MTTNCPTAPRNAEEGGQGGGDGENVVDAAAGGADATEAGTTESTYDACTARKTAKRKNEEFQEKLLNAITAPAPAPVEAPEPEQEYIDLAFAAIIKKMKKTLNDNEIMDAVEEVELVINHICREKRRRVAFQQAPASTKNIFEMLQPVSTNQQMGIGPTGPTAVPVNYNDDQFPQHLQF